MDKKYLLLILRVIGIVLVFGGVMMKFLKTPGADYLLFTGLALSVISLVGLMWVLGKAVRDK